MECSALRRTYNPAEMDRYEVEPGNMAIYIAPDRTCAFIQSAFDEASGEFHELDELEICKLWDRYRIISLLTVLKCRRLWKALPASRCAGTNRMC